MSNPDRARHDGPRASRMTLWAAVSAMTACGWPTEMVVPGCGVTAVLDAAELAPEINHGLAAKCVEEP